MSRITIVDTYGHINWLFYWHMRPKGDQLGAFLEFQVEIARDNQMSNARSQRRKREMKLKAIILAFISLAPTFAVAQVTSPGRGESESDYNRRNIQCNNLSHSTYDRLFTQDEFDQCMLDTYLREHNGNPDRTKSKQSEHQQAPVTLTPEEQKASKDSIDNCMPFYEKFKNAGQLKGMRWMDFLKLCRKNNGSERQIASALGIPMEERRKATNPQKSARIKKQSQERRGMDIDPRTQEPCVQMTMMSGYPKKMRILGGKTAVQYKYKVTNTCQKGYTVVPQTNAGWEGLAMVGANRSITWFCTDGNPANKDCKGGISGYTFK